MKNSDVTPSPPQSHYFIGSLPYDTTQGRVLDLILSKRIVQVSPRPGRIGEQEGQWPTDQR